MSDAPTKTEDADLILPVWQPVTLPVADSEQRFPVRRIFCVGRNYGEHAREMGHDPDRDPPFFFLKPAEAIAQNGSAVRYPSETEDLHHEVELVAAIGIDAANIAPEQAERVVFGYAVGIDLTRRDLQGEAKRLARPWEAGKVFEGAAPCGSIHRRPEGQVPSAGQIGLAVNGETRQDGDLGQMIWSVPEIISRLSRLFGLRSGDLVFTGTPAGVGAVTPGDRVEAFIDGLSPLAVTIAERRQDG